MSKGRLQTAKTVLLVNVPVTLLFGAVLEDHGDTEDENGIDSDDTKGGGEDLV